jgi:hypothetical protein
MRGAIRYRRAAARATLEHELSLIDSSIALLAAGGAVRVTLTGLRFAERILPAAKRTARARDVNVRALWRSGGVGCDITLEPLV